MAVFRPYSREIHLDVQNFAQIQKILVCVNCRAFPNSIPDNLSEKVGNIAPDFEAARPDSGADGRHELRRIAAEGPLHFPDGARQNPG